MGKLFKNPHNPGHNGPSPAPAGSPRKAFGGKELLDAGPNDPQVKACGPVPPETEMQAQERTSAPESLAESPATRFGRLRMFLNNFNPITVFYTRPRENLEAYRLACSVNDEEILSSPEVLRAKVNLKFTGAVAFSEVVGTCVGAPSLGVAFQEYTHNAYLGIAGTVIGDYLPAVLAFQVAWVGMNVGFYRHRAEKLLGRAKEFYRDLMPLHGVALLAALPAYMVGAALSAAIVFGINHLSPGAAENMKVMPAISEIVNFGVVETIYLYLLSAGSVCGIERIISRYSGYAHSQAAHAETPKAGNEPS